jgi:hypothetical protein
MCSTFTIIQKAISQSQGLPAHKILKEMEKSRDNIGTKVSSISTSFFFFGGPARQLPGVPTYKRH